MAAAWLLAVLLIGPMVADGQGTSAPVYSAESVANTAANVAGYYTPNSFVTIYGDNLSLTTIGIGPDEIRDGVLPTTLSGSGVRVNLSNLSAYVYYASPKQVNILLPPTLSSGRIMLQLFRSGVTGPIIPITLTNSAPAFFQSDEKTIIATHASGAVVTASSPARKGEIIVLWAGGLGATSPEAPAGAAPKVAAQIVDKAGFRLLLNGTAVDATRIQYAGLAPGFAGLYQVNVQLPDDAPENPEVRMSIGDQISPAGRMVPLQ